jgi:hypothetical protein
LASFSKFWQLFQNFGNFFANNTKVNYQPLGEKSPHFVTLLLLEAKKLKVYKIRTFENILQEVKGTLFIF